MVPFGSFAEVRDITGPALINRYNMYPAAPINGSADPSISSGQAIELMQQVVNKNLNWSMRSEWTELALLQLQTGNTAMMVFLLAVVLVFLVLAAQYESWSLPLAVILVVPMCLLCSIAAVLFAKLDVNIFTQVGFVVLIGLACKNAILIVEFARARREGGDEPVRLDASGLPVAIAADRDDVVRVHFGRGPAGDRRRGRERKCVERWEPRYSAACLA